MGRRDHIQATVHALDGMNSLGITSKSQTREQRQMAQMIKEFNHGFGVYHRLRHHLSSDETSPFHGNVNLIVQLIMNFLRKIRKDVHCRLLHLRRYRRNLRSMRIALLDYVKKRRGMLLLVFQSWTQNEVIFRERAKQKLQVARQRGIQSLIQASQDELMQYFIHSDLKWATIKRMFFLRRLKFAKSFEVWKQDEVRLRDFAMNRIKKAYEIVFTTTNREVLEYEHTEVVRAVFALGEHKKLKPHFGFDPNSVKIEELLRLVESVRDSAVESELIAWEKQRDSRKRSDALSKGMETGKEVKKLEPAPDVIPSKNATVSKLKKRGQHPSSQSNRVDRVGLMKQTERGSTRSASPTVSDGLFSLERVVSEVKNWRPAVRVTVYPSLDKTWTDDRMKAHESRRIGPPMRSPNRNMAHQNALIYTFFDKSVLENASDNQDVPILDKIMAFHVPGAHVPALEPVERCPVRISGIKENKILPPTYHTAPRTAAQLKQRFVPFRKENIPTSDEKVVVTHLLEHKSMRTKRVSMNTYLEARKENDGFPGLRASSPLPPSLQNVLSVAARPRTGILPHRHNVSSLPTPSFLGRDIQERVRSVLARETLDTPS